MLSIESKQTNFWRNTSNGENMTTHLDKVFEVPQASIILLSLLGFCLIALFILFLILRQCQSRLMDQAVGKGRSFSYSQIETAECELDGGVEISEKDYELYPLSPNIKTHVNKDVYQNPPPLLTAVMQISVQFTSTTGRLVVEIERLKSVAKNLLRSGIVTSVEIHARLLPLPDKFRYKTSSRPIIKPEFHERFAFDGFTEGDIQKCWFRFRLYSQRRMGKKKLLGQVNIGVNDIQFDRVWSTLNLDILPSEEVYKLLTKER